MPIGNELAAQIIDTALRGEEIHRAPAMKLIPGGRADGAPVVSTRTSRGAGTAA